MLCKKYLKINQLYQGSPAVDPAATRSATQFLNTAFDDKTPFAKLQFALRDTGLNPGSGFPVDAQGKPVKWLSWGCKQLGYRPLELWVRDADGNAAYCPTAVSMGDMTKLCKDSLVGGSVDWRREEPSEGGFELFQNQPNPFSEVAEVPFFIPQNEAVRLRVFDGLGRLVLEESRFFEAGLNAFVLEKRSGREAVSTKSRRRSARRRGGFRWAGIEPLKYPAPNFSVRLRACPTLFRTAAEPNVSP